MADAAKKARGAFNDIKDGAGEMGRDVNVNMSEARHGIMLLGEEFGVRLPRALFRGPLLIAFLSYQTSLPLSIGVQHGHERQPL